ARTARAATPRQGPGQHHRDTAPNRPTGSRRKPPSAERADGRSQPDGSHRERPTQTSPTSSAEPPSRPPSPTRALPWSAHQLIAHKQWPTTAGYKKVPVRDDEPVMRTRPDQTFTVTRSTLDRGTRDPPSYHRDGDNDLRTEAVYGFFPRRSHLRILASR